MNLQVAAFHYQTIREQIKHSEPDIDERTLADTVEGLTDFHDILIAVVRSALDDEALAAGLKGRMNEMQDRLARLQDRASKRRQIARDVMTEVGIKNIAAPDFTVSLRAGSPAVVVLDETTVPGVYWTPVQPRLNKAQLAIDLKGGMSVAGATLSNPAPVLSIKVR